MRHKKKFNHLSRKSAHRKAMLANMANSLILHKRIQTTVAKAKALRSYVEPLITKSKEDTTHSRRIVFSYLKDKYAVSELFREVSTKVMNRAGGYTRIIKTGSRLGDSADMCFIELVDYNENLLGLKEEAKAKTTSRRSRRSRTKKTEDAAVPAQEVVTETGSVETAVESTTEPEDSATNQVNDDAAAEQNDAKSKEEK